MYEMFDHTADLGFRMTGATLADVFIAAGECLTACIIENPDALETKEVITSAIAGDDREFLLFDWLRELLMRFEADRFLGRKFLVDLTEQGLTATVHGEVLDPTRHRPAHEVKAITYHGLRVEATATGWLAEVIVDI